LFPATRSARRFEKIGLPLPKFLGTFASTFEILCGALIFIGLFGFQVFRLSSIMLIAIGTTKADVLANQGFWEIMHGCRTDCQCYSATFSA
jgi:uncharacterized membrane protein YphA (DoxX/SURF4 family)